MDITKYTVFYEYLDRRGHRRGRTITLYSLEKVKDKLKELKSLEGKQGGPIDIPLVTKLENGEAKVVNNLY